MQVLLIQGSPLPRKAISPDCALLRQRDFHKDFITAHIVVILLDSFPIHQSLFAVGAH